MSAELEVSTTAGGGVTPSSHTSRLPRTVSANLHRRFDSVTDYVKQLGGSKSHIIEKVLIANNGVAAVKAIRSIRKWAYDIFGNESTIQFVVMATPEDLRANAEYIRMGDVIVDVPGGSNNHNYANVTLIVELARLHGVNAVWAGWGHASENPTLPDTLMASHPPIKFIGPAGPPMRALGDKIGSTIIAQTAGVPCIGWNGSHVRAEYDRASGELPADAYNSANVRNATEALEAASRVGFPVMIKASEGGGGKGIRMVSNIDGVQNAYRQVCGEVPGSPIFIMKLSTNSRHLEVQLLGDEYGDAIALNGRDCSVQRRHQKIIEEGPPTAASPAVWSEMEKAAVSLAKAVGYTNAGTVEYLYSEDEHKFYFLELNPRLQVEHPVTEMITRVNLPAAQLQVAMGIPLYHIPEIRQLYGENRFEDQYPSPIDFTTQERVPAYGHCIAVRITAENAEAGFKPTSGGIQELNFRSTPNVWGYFSMDSSGSIHEFADSQFGHLFASGIDREQARRNMVLALKELSIRGDISTTIDYICKLLELEDFIDNEIDTAWLDKLIQSNQLVSATTSSAANKRTSRLHNDTLAVIGASIVTYDRSIAGETQFEDALQKGQLPSASSLLAMSHNVELILEGVKYTLECTRKGPNKFSVSLSDSSSTNKCVETNVRLLSDGGYLTEVGGKSIVAYLTSRGDANTGMRLTIGGITVSFSPDYDPTSLRTDVAGKLVKKLVPDGSHVEKGQPYCEIEVMKMFMPLKVEESGILTWSNNEGASMSPGDLLATLELDNPDNVETATIFDGDLQVDGWKDLNTPNNSTNRSRPHLLLRSALESLEGGINGFILSSHDLQQAMDDLFVAGSNPLLPVYEIKEQLSVLSGRIDGGLHKKISNMLISFEHKCADEANEGSLLRFSADQVEVLLVSHADSYDDSSERDTFIALTTPLRDAVAPYVEFQAAGVPGSNRVREGFLYLLRRWIAVEQWFHDGRCYADAVDALRKANKENSEAVLKICRSHGRLQSTSKIIMNIVEAIGEAGRIDPSIATAAPVGRRISVLVGGSNSEALPCLSEIGSMNGNSTYAAVALKARKVIMQESLPDIEQRKDRVRSMISLIKDSLNSPQKVIPQEVKDLLSENVPFIDIFYSLLDEVSSVDEMLALTQLVGRKMYLTQTIRDFSTNVEERFVKFTFTNKSTENVLSNTTPITSMTDLTRVVSRSGSMNNLSELLTTPTTNEDLSSPEGDMLHVHPLEEIPHNIPRTAVCLLIDSVDEVKENSDKFTKVLEAFPQFNGSIPCCEFGPTNVLYIIFTKDRVEHSAENMDDIVCKLENCLIPLHYYLEKADIRRVSFIFNNAKSDDELYSFNLPAIFTYRQRSGFKEDTLYRDMEPNQAYRLELIRLAKNFSVQRLISRQTTTGKIYTYRATPKSAALLKDRSAKKEPRIFVRAIGLVFQFSSTSFEGILVDALNALDLSMSESTSNNHVFINLVGDHDHVVLDPVVVEQVVVSILKRHGERISQLGIAEVETKIVCCLSADSPPIGLRMIASNPTGYVQVVDSYVEGLEQPGSEPVLKLIGGTKASLACTGDNSWEGLKVSTPYPLTRPFDAQRKAALRSSDTLYCYDLPALFEAAVEQQWIDASSKGGIEGSIRAISRPLMVMYTTELVVQKKDGSSGSWTMDDYLNGDLELTQVTRRAGANNVGMVAWLMTLKTVEYPNGRQVVLIANDITFKAGSFGTREDVVFKLASELAREKRIPRLYVAANSGARIGLAESVKKMFKVSFKDQTKPENGFNFLYVTKQDYEQLTCEEKQIIVEPINLNGEEVYKITDIIGIEPDLGVENLKGSGLIAGETSVAYNDIFTMTIVLGRTVGIGAYLVRLGQRTIQKVSNSPIILTGYQALNKLMGVDVYSTNDQLGGPAIMYSNGVSHMTEPDHLRAVTSAIGWLSFVPSVRGGLLPITDISGIDNIDRKIDFCPSPGVPYDPRLLLTGYEDDEGDWQSGFFDKDSFVESLAGWAKSVIVGRARLGGIPMGVIATENRTAEAIKPADPADVKASEAIIQEAGGVWFPNSAYKTAQTINDFRTEDLPLMVFANWRGFSGGQRDMFDEVLKYGSQIVDAFVAYEQPVFVFIPPCGEIRGGAWVVLDPSINSSVMEMYASSGSARGGVLEANGAASVKYRVKDLLKTMHRLDDCLISLTTKLHTCTNEKEKAEIKESISGREKCLIPVYEQIAVQFCELHDTPGRMKAVGVIERDVDWPHARSYFFWRLRRKLAEFDLRKKMVDAAEVGRNIKALSPKDASAMIKKWFVETPGMDASLWNDDKVMLSWMANNHADLEQKVMQLTKECVVQEVFAAMTAGGNTAQIGSAGIVEGISRACDSMTEEQKEQFKKMLKDTLNL